MDDEFKSFGNEMNKPIPEYKEIEAMEYYPVTEAVLPPDEVLPIDEDSADSSSDGAKTDSLSEARERLDRIEKFRNTSDGVKSPDINISSSEGAAETAGNAIGRATVAQTVSTLAGPVTVIAAAAAVVASVTGGVLEKVPQIISESYEVGTNYIKYDIELGELSEAMDYVIRIKKPGFVVEYPVVEEGIQRQIVPDLLPNRAYDLQIVGISKELGEIVYYSHECFTDILTKPKAVFEFTPHFDYILGRVDLEYQTYISDYYNNGSNSYLQIYSGDKLLLEDKEMPEDHFFTGTIQNIGSANSISAFAYTDWFDGLNTYKDTQIGAYGYEIEYPEDFTLKNVFDGSYTFGESNISKTFDLDSGTNISINTNFNSANSNEYYRIDLFNNNEIIDSITSKEKIVNINVDAYIKNVDLVFTPLRDENDDVIEFESTIIKEYDVDPKIFYDINFYQYTSGYYFECRASDEYKSKLGEKPINLKIETFFKDGTSIAKTNDGGLIDGELISLEAALSEDESKTIDDVKSFEISITYDDKVIYKSNVNPLNELTVSSADVDDDGNVVIPFEINLEAAEDISFEAYVSENEAQVEFDNNSGNIIIKEINSNIVNISLQVSYVKEGITNNASLVLEEVNLGADYEVSYFISHSGSYYSYFNIRFDATINGKNVNIDLTPEVTEDGNTASEQSYNKYLDYHCYSYSSNVTYKVTNEGFNNTEVTITPNTGIGDSDNAKYDSNINNYSYGYYDSANDEYYAYYNKSLNSDGTVNYYFDVPFKENSTGHYLRIEGSYVLDGVTKYIHSDLLTSDFKLENLKNYDYNFVIRGYYLKDDVLYDTELGYNKYYLNTRIISDILSGSQTFLGSLASTNDTNDVVLDLTLNPIYFDTKNGLVLNYLNKNYQIDILESGSNSLVVKEYGNYTGIGYDFSNSEYGYSYIYYDEDDNGNYQKLKVEFYLINEGDKDLDLNSTVTYYVKDALAGGDAIKSTVNIIENTISYDKDKVEVEVEEMTSINRIIVKAPDYTSSNSIYKLYAVAYYNGKEITREAMSSGQASLFIDKGYSDLEIKLEEALDQKAEPLNYDTGDSDFKIVLGSDSVDATIPSAEAKISTIEVINPDNGDTYNVTITADNFDDYYIEAVVNYTDSNGNIISNTFAGEKGSTSLVFERDTNYTLDNIEVHIKDDYNVLNSVIVPATVTLGEADVDEKIVIPYEINVPNVVALEGDSTVTLGDNNVSIDALKGSFEIDNITTKENAVQFDITYIKDGILVTARIVKNYVFEVDFDYDIELGIYSDSSYDYYNDGNLSIQCGNNDSQITYYFYRADIIVDAYFKGYKLSGFTDYVVNITSGGMVSAADGGYVCASKTSGYSLTGSEGTNRILMLHYVTIENNVITSIDKVELEFNIDGGESHLFTYDIPQYETSDAIFSIDKSNSFDWVATVDGTNTLTFDTGFDSTANPNYVYKVFVYNSDEEILSESNLLAKSADYETGSNITFTGLPESNYGYHVMVKGYYKFGDTIIDISNKLYVEIENVHATFSYSSEIYPYYSGKEGVVKISTNALLSDAVITYTINPGDSTNTATDTINLSELTTETRNYINDYIQVYIEDDSDEGYIFIKFMVSSKNYNNYLTSAEISVENKIGETKTVTI